MNGNLGEAGRAEQKLETRGSESPVIMGNEMPSGRERNGQKDSSPWFQATKGLTQKGRGIGDMFQCLGTEYDVRGGVVDRPPVSLIVGGFGHGIAEIRSGAAVIQPVVGCSGRDERPERLSTATHVQNQ